MTINFFPPGQASGWSPTFAPPMIPGCLLWLRGDLGITLNSGNVSSWADQSGLNDPNKNVTQATGSKQPAYNAVDGAYNGQATLSFTAASVSVLRSGTWSVAPAQPLTVVFVGEGSTATQYMFDGINGAAFNNLACFLASANRMELDAGAGLAVNTGIYAGQQCLAAVFNGATSSLYQNNSRTPTISGNAGSTAITGMAVGGDGPGTADSLNGKIAEFIMYSQVLTTPQLNQLFVYLSNRYAPGAWA